MLDGVTYPYTYGDNNELQTIRIPGVGNIDYPSYTLNRPDSMTMPGGSQSYQYDALMRLETLNAPDSGLNYGYTYDHVSNILTKSIEHGNYGYGYDDVYRLTTADNPIQDDEAYTYDNVGNRDAASDVTGTITHNANNELTVYGDISYDYDANGNMIRKSAGSVAVNYIYNVQHRLIRVEDELSRLVLAEYDYDPFGRRLWKEVDGTRTYFFYSDEGLVAEYDESDNEIRSYGYQPDSTWTTDPLWLKEGREYYFYQNDHLGTPQKLIDINGTGVWSAQYTAFGEAQVQVATITNNLRFPGQYYDTETGLYYNFHRYYDSGIGRYLRTDPIEFGGKDVNLYAYVWNGQVNWGDFSGLYRMRSNGLEKSLETQLKFNQWAKNQLNFLPDFILDMFFPLDPQEVLTDATLKLVCPLGTVDPRSMKAIRSLQKQIALHKKKLAEFIKDPYKFDNKGLLKNAPTEEIKQWIIDGRIRHLQHEIEVFKKQIQDILSGGF